MPIVSQFPSGDIASGLTLEPTTNIQTMVASEKVYIKWTDPEDMVISDLTLAEWKGTLLVRKAGSIPADRRDGTIVIDSIVHNAYADTYLVDTGLSNGVTYYYKLFPYTSNHRYTVDSSNEFTAIPMSIAPNNVSNISASIGSEKIKLSWADPENIVVDNITISQWSGTQVVYKAGSYPISPEDGTVALNSQVKNAYKDTTLIIDGLTNGVTYYISLFPYSIGGGINANENNRISATPVLTPVSAIPTQTGVLTYNTTVQSPTWNNYDNAKMTLGGTVSGSNAGTYNALFTLGEDYCWPDGSTEPKTVSWVIGRATIPNVPNQSNTLTFTGATLSPTWANYNSGQLTLGGTVSGINAGSYNATFTPTGNYKWSDNTVVLKTVTWAIGKAAGSLSLSATSLNLSTSTPSGTITVTRAGNGVVSAISNNTSIAIVTVSGTTITVTGVTSGTTTITVNVAAGTNHLAPTNHTITVNVNFLPAKDTLENTSWADIKTIVDAGQAINYWSIGDFKSVTINGVVNDKSFTNNPHRCYIIGFDHNSSIEGNGMHLQFAMASSGVSYAFTDSKVDRTTTSNNYFNMNREYINANGWTGSNMYNTCTKFFNALSSDLQSVISICKKYTDNVGGNEGDITSITPSSSKIFLPSEYEVTGTITNSNRYESDYQKQYSFYANANSSIKYRDTDVSSEVSWWLRSPAYNTSYAFCAINSLGEPEAYAASYSFGFAPIFKI